MVSGSVHLLRTLTMNFLPSGQDKNAEAASALAAKHDQIKSAEADLATLMASAQNASAAVDTATTALEDAETELNRLMALGTAAQKDLEDKKAEVAAAESALATMQREIDIVHNAGL